MSKKPPILGGFLVVKIVLGKSNRPQSDARWESGNDSTTGDLTAGGVASTRARRRRC